MRISQLYLVVCAAALCGGLIAARADDNPDQAAARAALEAKMRELNTEPVTNNTPAPAPVKPAQQTPSVAPTMPAAQNPPAAVPEKTEQPAPAKAAAPSATGEQATHVPTTTVNHPTQKTEHASTASNTNGDWFETVPPPSGSRHVTTESQPTTEPKAENPEPSTPVRTAPPAPVQQPVYTEHHQNPNGHQNPNAPYPGQRLGMKPIDAPPFTVRRPS